MKILFFSLLSCWTFEGAALSVESVGSFEHIQLKGNFQESAVTQTNVYRGEEIRDLLTTLNEWVVSHYIDFPFLYVAQGEIPPNHVLADDLNSFVLFAEKKGRKVGLITASPLNSPFLVDVKYSPFFKLSEVEAKGYNPEKILYVHGFLLSNEERQNKELIERLYQNLVQIAKEMGKTQICYFTTLREEDHPLKPVPYVPPEPWDELSAPFRSNGYTI